MNGLSAAFWASISMFLPSFFLVGILVKLIPYLRKSNILSAFLDAVNAGAVRIMAAVILKLGYGFVEDWRAILLMGLSILITFKFPKISSVWVIAGGALLGYGF